MPEAKMIRFYEIIVCLCLVDAVLSTQDPSGHHYRKKRLPYQVSVEVFGEFRCTGAIINVFWVVTVGSCLHNVSTSDVIVRAAAAVTQRHGSVHRVRQLLTSPSCSADGQLTMLRMLTRFTFSRVIRPITLWPSLPPLGETGWSTVWPCHQKYMKLNTQRRVSFVGNCTEDQPGMMCVVYEEEEHNPRATQESCQNVGALVVSRNRLTGFLLNSYNSTFDHWMAISPYIPWIKQTAFETA